MSCMDRTGRKIKQDKNQNRILKYLYTTIPGRILLSVLIKPGISKVCAVFLNSGISKIFIKKFIKVNHIDMKQFEKIEYTSYNAFFTRKIKSEYRKIDQNKNHLISPCDSKLSVYKITEKAEFKIKDTIYTLETLLRSKKIANRYKDGTLLLFRLTVDDYHRYCYIDSGDKSKNYHIKGLFHTVNPIANTVVPVYKENTREFSLLKSDNFGDIIMMEVGALLVGKIINYDEKLHVDKGKEKGRFEFGGSTIIICLQKGSALIDIDIMNNSMNDIETVVKMGEKIGIHEI